MAQIRVHDRRLRVTNRRPDSDAATALGEPSCGRPSDGTWKTDSLVFFLPGIPGGQDPLVAGD